MSLNHSSSHQPGQGLSVQPVGKEGTTGTYCICGLVLKTDEKKLSWETNRVLQNSTTEQERTWQVLPNQYLLCLALHPGDRRPAGYEARVPGEPQEDQQEETERDVDLGEGEGSQIPVFLLQYLIRGLLTNPFLLTEALFRTRGGKDKRKAEQTGWLRGWSDGSLNVGQ